MKNIYIVRQSAVVPSDYSKPKDWREVVFFKWAKKRYPETKMIMIDQGGNIIIDREETTFRDHQDKMLQDREAVLC